MADKIPFKPIRGTEASIRSIPKADIEEGALYFALDTKKIFYGSQEKELLIPMGGNSGIYFGKKTIAAEDDANLIQFSDLYDIERDEGVDESELTLLSLNKNDLILNTNGSFYKVLSSIADGIDLIYETQKVTIAGGGGGGGSSSGTSPNGTLVGTLDSKNLLTTTVLAGTEGEFIIPFIIDTRDANGEPMETPVTALVQRAGLSSTAWDHTTWVEGENQITIRDLTYGSHAVDIKSICKMITDEGETQYFRIKLTANTGGEVDNVSVIKFSLYLTPAMTSWSDFDNARYHTLFHRITDDSFNIEYTFAGLNLYHYVEFYVDDNFIQRSESIKDIGIQNSYLFSIPSASLSGYAHSFQPFSFKVFASATNDLNKFTCIKTYNGFIMIENPNQGDYIIGIPMDTEQDLIQYNLIPIPVVIYSVENTGALLIYSNDQGDYDDSAINVQNETWQIFNFNPQNIGINQLVFNISGVETSKIIEFNVIGETWNEIGTEVRIPQGGFKFLANSFTSTTAFQNYANQNGITFSDNFDFHNGGIKTEKDEDENLRSYLLIKAGTTVTFPYRIFSSAEEGKTIKNIGRNFKIVFEAVDCEKYDCVLGGYGEIVPQQLDPESPDGLKWKKDEFGVYEFTPDGYPIPVYEEGKDLNHFILKAQYADIYMGDKIPNVKYIENELIELDFNINNSTDDEGLRYVEIWLNGTPYGVSTLSSSTLIIDNKDLVLGSPECDVKIYLIKGYPQSLNNYSRLRNFIADSLTYTERKRRYNRNNVLKLGSSNLEDISIPLLIKNNPECIVHTYEIPRMGIDKKKKDPIEHCKYKQYRSGFEALNTPYAWSNDCTIGVQGTSSVNYIISAANIDTDFAASSNPADRLIYYGHLDGDGNWTDHDSNGYFTSEGYSLTETSIPCTYLNTKVNVASAENANNALLQEEYSKFNPFKSVVKDLADVPFTDPITGEQRFGKHRDTMEFTNGLLFFIDKNTVTKDTPGVMAKNRNVFCEDEEYMSKILAGNIEGVTPKFYAICNMGNSKNNQHVFHRPDEICVECKDNPDPYAMMYMQSSKADFDNHFELRNEPDFDCEYAKNKGLDSSKDAKDYWLEFTEWMVKYNPAEIAHKDDIPEEEQEPLPSGEASETFERFKFSNKAGSSEWITSLYETTNSNGDTVISNIKEDYSGTYTYDCYEYRMAKMLSECEEHLAMDSLIYHYLFIEKHTMIDNVTKNTFWSANADSKYKIWDLSKDYDNDTADGNNNSGYLTIDYGYECFDRNNQIEKEAELQEGQKKSNTIFNAAQWCAWINFIGGLPSVLAEAYRKLSKQLDWITPTNYLKKVKEWQNKIPEICWILDAYRKYKRPNTVFGDTTYLKRLEGGKKTFQRAAYEEYQCNYLKSKYLASEDIYNSRTFFKPTDIILIPIKYYQKGYIQAAIANDVYFPKQRVTDINKFYYLKTPDNYGGEETIFKLYTPELVSELGQSTEFGLIKDSVSQNYRPATAEEYNNYKNEPYTSPNAIFNSSLCGLVMEALNFDSSSGKKLSSLILGDKYDIKKSLYNNKVTELALSAPLLKHLEMQNYVLGTKSLDLANLKKLKYLNLTKTTTGSVIIADNAPLETLILNNPSGELNLSNLYKLQEIHLSEGSLDNTIGLSNTTGLYCNNIDINDQFSLPLYKNCDNSLIKYALQDIKWTITDSSEINDGKILMLEDLFNLDGDEHHYSITTYKDAITTLSNLLYGSIIFDRLIQIENPRKLYERYVLGCNENRKLIYDSKTNSYIENPSYYAKDLDLIMDNSHSKLYNFIIYNGDESVCWKSKFHEFNDIEQEFYVKTLDEYAQSGKTYYYYDTSQQNYLPNNSLVAGTLIRDDEMFEKIGFFDLGVCNTGVEAFNINKIFKDNDSEHVYTFTNKWIIKILDQDNAEVASFSPDEEITDFNTFDFNTLLSGRGANTIICIPQFDSTDRSYTLYVKFDTNGKKEAYETITLHLPYRTNLQEIIASITTIPWQISENDDPWVYRKWIGLTTLKDGTVPANSFQIISDDKILYAVFKAYNLKELDEYSEEERSLGMPEKYFSFSRSVEGSGASAKYTAKIKINSTYNLNGKIVIPSTHTYGGRTYTVNGLWTDARSGAITAGVTHVLFDKDVIKSDFIIDNGACAVNTLKYFEFYRFESIESIGTQAFSNTKLTNSSLPLVKELGYKAFENSFVDTIKEFTFYLPTNCSTQVFIQNNTKNRFTTLHLKLDTTNITGNITGSIFNGFPDTGSGAQLFCNESGQSSDTITQVYYPQGLSFGSSYTSNNFISNIKSYFSLKNTCIVSEEPRT